MIKTRTKPAFIVAIGGSAGGLAAYKALLAALPADTGMAFVVISHMPAAAVSHLAEILSKCTAMIVREAATGMPILADHVYVNSPNSDLLVEGEAFKLVFPRQKRNREVDRFFKSLADDVGARAVAVILSGYDGDGTVGCGHVKSKGGTTFTQDGSAEIASMPLNAQASGCVDYVLPPELIARKLVELARA